MRSASTVAGLQRSQIKKLVAKLDRRHVHQREIGGKTISYIEGWFAIAEANAIFGFDGWDRETLQSERLFEQTQFRETVCAYSARVRIRVHAGSRVICRDGTGTGVATAGVRADAHEKALKAAETDATKRALATFGNRFGLTLYDKDKNGLAGSPSTGKASKFVLYGAKGEGVADEISAEAFCGALRQLIERTGSVGELAGLRAANAPALARLKTEFPRLVSSKGTHFSHLIEGLFATRHGQLQPKSALADIPEEETPTAATSCPVSPHKVDKSQLAIGTERRERNKAHLLFVAGKPCLICEELPCHAHHITFAQSRGLAIKVSDEFVVPLCAMHHNLLHLHGNEAAFWRQHGIEPLATARLLWRETLALNVS